MSSDFGHDGEPDIGRYLARVPFLAEAPPAAARRLGGLTNLNYLVGHDGGRFVLRIPGAGTSEYIDREAEGVAARAAADAGVNAEVMFFDPSDGLMVTRYVDASVTMDPARFRDLDAVTRAGQAFHRLHARSRPFATDFQLFPMIDGYLQLLQSKGAALPFGYIELQQRADDTRRALESSLHPLVPSHCDPLCENFLDTGDVMFIIDYEYAGNNDPMWDLADLAVEGEFGHDQDLALLRAYFERDPAPSEIGRMVAYKALCDLLWTLWGVIQHANGNTAEDFWAYATNRFDRCRVLMSDGQYPDHLRAIGAT